MHAWLDVTAGVAGDMLMGALIDAGADLAGVRAAVRAVAGEHVGLRTEQVVRAGLLATKVHVDINARGTGALTWPQLRQRVAEARLPDFTRERALATLERLARAYSQGHALALDRVALQEVAALDVLADIVGDCEGLRLLGADIVTASPVALGSGRIRTSHGDLPVPVPAVAELADGWPVIAVGGGERSVVERVDAAAHAFAGATGHVPLGGVTTQDGVLTEAPAQVIRGEGELATPTGMALLRTLAGESVDQAPFVVVSQGTGAGGRDVPGRPNVVRVLLGER